MCNSTLFSSIEQKLKRIQIRWAFIRYTCNSVNYKYLSHDLLFCENASSVTINSQMFDTFVNQT